MIAGTGRFVSALVLVGALGCSAPRPAAPHAPVAHCAALHWIDLDRSPTVRLVQVLARRASDQEAAALADQVRAAVEGVRSLPPTRFVDPIDSSTAQGEDPVVIAIRSALLRGASSSSDVHVNVLPLVSAGGLVVDRGIAPSLFEHALAAQGAALAARGDVSGVVRTPYGAHILVLLERVPGVAADDAMLRRFCARVAPCE